MAKLRANVARAFWPPINMVSMLSPLHTTQRFEILPLSPVRLNLKRDPLLKQNEFFLHVTEVAISVDRKSLVDGRQSFVNLSYLGTKSVIALVLQPCNVCIGFVSTSKQIGDRLTYFL